MHPEQHQAILTMVREQLERTNPPSTEALYGRAIRIDDSVRDLSLRQFNARYPLQVRRKMAEGANEDAQSSTDEPFKGEAGSIPADRDALRQVFHDLAVEVAGAESGPQLIDLVVNGIDKYVDRAVAALLTS